MPQVLHMLPTQSADSHQLQVNVFPVWGVRQGGGSGLASRASDGGRPQG